MADNSFYQAEVIAADERKAEAVLRQIAASIPKGTLVIMDSNDDNNRFPVDKNILRQSLNLAMTGRPIILVSYRQELHWSELADWPSFYGLIGRQNVTFVCLKAIGNGEGTKRVSQAYQRICDGLGFNHLLAIALATIWRQLEDVDDPGIESPVINRILRQSQPQQGFPGIFVDANALLCRDRWVRRGLRVELEELAETKPITVLINNEQQRVALRLCHLGWLAVSFSQLRDLCLEEGWSCLPEDEFRQRYQIKVRKFVEL